MLKNYLIITLKVLQRRKFFTFVNLFGISFTLMLLVVVAAFLDHSFSPMGTEHRFDRVLTMTSFRMRSPDLQSNWSSNASFYLIDHYLRPLQAQSKGALTALSIYKNEQSSVAYRNGTKIEFVSRHVDGSYFDIVDLKLIDGQLFTADDDVQRNFVAVISQALQQRYFDGAPAVGQNITFDNQTYQIIGVVENVPETRQVAFADIWLPISTDKNTAYNASPTANGGLMGSYNCALMVKSESDKGWAKQAVKDAMSNVEFIDPKEYATMESAARNTFEHTAAELFADWDERFSKEYDNQLRWAIIIAMGIFMLLPSLNLTNLNLSRMMERAAEIGVRRAFGASVNSLLQQFVIENIIISFIGGLLGLGGAVLALTWLNGSGFFEYSNFGINYRVLGAGFVITFAFGLFSGVYPAWRMAKLHPVYALKGASK